MSDSNKSGQAVKVLLILAGLVAMSFLTDYLRETGFFKSRGMTIFYVVGSIILIYLLLRGKR